jgi:hypothetical protein
LDLTAQIIDASDQAQDGLIAITASEVAGTEVLVLDAVFEHVVSGGIRSPHYRTVKTMLKQRMEGGRG